jgi:hypothetical protein
MPDGWSRPLEIEINVRKPELASAMQRGYDKSGLHRRSGRLRAELGKIANYTVKKLRDTVTVTARIAVVYARILDEGGQVPDRRPRNAKFMHFFAYGREFFLKFVRGFTMRPFGYIKTGLETFMERYGLKGGVEVKWK